MTKLLAVDLDGTLLRRDGDIAARDARAVARVQALGVPVTIVTGRLFAGTQSFAEQLKIRGPVACADGAQLVDPSRGRELEHHGIVGAARESLRDTLSSLMVATFALYDEGVVYDARGAGMSRYVRSWTPKLEEVGDLFEHRCWRAERGISAVVVVGPGAELGHSPEALRSSGLFEIIDFEITHSLTGEPLPATRALLVHTRGATKGTAVAKLAARHGCRAGEVAAVGDWLNDIDMFHAAGRSFAMAHAPATVRAAATDVLSADAKSGGGVAEAIEALWPTGG